MKIASHNSWTFKRPSQWWLRPFQFVARCQEKNIAEQYYLGGVRCFDLRLKWYKGAWWNAHGIMRFGKVDTFDLACLNHLEDVSVRVTLEYNKDASSLIPSFLEYVEELQKRYPRIKWFGGKTKWDWKTVITFPDSPTITEKHSSVSGKYWIERLWPKRWAKKHNEEVLAEGTDSEFLMIDYV